MGNAPREDVTGRAPHDRVTPRVDPDVKRASGKHHPHLGVDTRPSFGDRYGDRRTCAGAAGLRDADAALPDDEVDLGRRTNDRELDVGARGERRVLFDAGADAFDVRA